MFENGPGIAIKTKCHLGHVSESGGRLKWDKPFKLIIISILLFLWRTLNDDDDDEELNIIFNGTAQQCLLLTFNGLMK